MTRTARLLLIDGSECGCDEAARRLKACSQMSVMAYLTEPSWQVLLDPSEERVKVTIGDRSYGDSDSGDEDVMSLYFRTPSTLHDLGAALMESSERLDQVLAVQPRETVPDDAVRDDALPGEAVRDMSGPDDPAASDGSGRRDS